MQIGIPFVSVIVFRRSDFCKSFLEKAVDKLNKKYEDRNSGSLQNAAFYKRAGFIISSLGRVVEALRKGCDEILDEKDDPVADHQALLFGDLEDPFIRLLHKAESVIALLKLQKRGANATSMGEMERVQELFRIKEREFLQFLARERNQFLPFVGSVLFI